MISLTADSHLPLVRLQRDNQSDFVFQGMMLANRAVSENNGRKRHLVSLYRTQAGKYVLSCTVSTLLFSGRALNTAQAICFSSVDDVRDYLNTEQRALGDALGDALVLEARQGDWGSPQCGEPYEKQHMWS